MTPDGTDEILDDAKFDDLVKHKKEDGTLPEFTAHLVWTMSKNCDACQGSSYTKKQSTVVSITSSITAAILAFISARFTGGSN